MPHLQSGDHSIEGRFFVTIQWIYMTLFLSFLVSKNGENEKKETIFIKICLQLGRTDYLHGMKKTVKIEVRIAV
ncbi:hypothetical protein DI44_09295 [Geobacillus sp. CAMR5420]|nr:hypothetical protein DI44_09295 [Geobacillus sp. CAMR5420]